MVASEGPNEAFFIATKKKLLPLQLKLGVHWIRGRRKQKPWPPPRLPQHHHRLLKRAPPPGDQKMGSKWG